MQSFVLALFLYPYSQEKLLWIYHSFVALFTQA